MNLVNIQSCLNEPHNYRDNTLGINSETFEFNIDQLTSAQEIRAAIRELEIRMTDKKRFDVAAFNQHEALVAKLRMVEGGTSLYSLPATRINDWGNNMNNANTQGKLDFEPVFDVKNEIPLSPTVILETVKLDLIGRKIQTLERLEAIINILEKSDVTNSDLEKVHPMLFGISRELLSDLILSLKVERDRLWEIRQTALRTRQEVSIRKLMLFDPQLAAMHTILDELAV